MRCMLALITAWKQLPCPSFVLPRTHCCADVAPQVDVLTIIPFDLFVIQGGFDSQVRMIKVIRVLRLLKIVKVVRASSIIQRWENSFAIQSTKQTLSIFAMATVVLVNALHRPVACVCVLDGGGLKMTTGMIARAGTATLVCMSMVARRDATNSATHRYRSSARGSTDTAHGHRLDVHRLHRN